MLTATAGLSCRIQAVVADGGSVLRCGGGQFTQRLIGSHPGITMTGIDLSAEQITRARTRSKALPPDDAVRLHFQTASALDPPFADNSFDAAVSIASIKHWPDRAKGIAEMVRVLPDGGLLLGAETDRGCRLDDPRRFARETRLSAPLRPPFLWMFRTYVAGQGLDLDATVGRIADAPFLAFTGTKRHYSWGRSLTREK